MTREQYEAAQAAIAPHLAPTLDRLPERFTTPDFISALWADPAGKQAYQQAMQIFMADLALARMAGHIVHGQVIPDLLRRSGRVRFAGFAHHLAQEQHLGVPSWWHKLDAPPPRASPGGRQ